MIEWRFWCLRICLWIFIFVCNMDGVNSSLHVVTHLQPLGYPNSYISCARSPGSRWEAQLILLYFCSGPTLYECASHSFETQPGGRPGLMIGSRVRWVDPGQQKKNQIKTSINTIPLSYPSLVNWLSNFQTAFQLSIHSPAFQSQINILF
jgi:hypothetical protein